MKLDTFTVQSEKDYGYRATNSITATGIGTEIYRTPIAVSVITSDLMKDIGAVDLVQAAAYTASIQMDSRNEAALYVRGFPAPLLVNSYTASASRADATSPLPNPSFTERVELAKGPNAVFFGRVSPSGIVNVITLQPKSRDLASVSLGYGSYDYKKVVVDVNQTLGKDAALRVAASYLDKGDWLDFTSTTEKGLYAAFTWALASNLRLNLTASTNRKDELPWFALPRGDPGYTEYTRLNPAEDITISEWVTRYRPPNTPFITYLPDPYQSFPDGPRGNVNGPDGFEHMALEYFQPELVYSPADWLTLRLGASFSSDQFSELQTSGFPTYNGTIYRQRPTWDGRGSNRGVVEGQAVAKFDLGPSHHQLLVGGMLNHERFGTFSISGNPLTWNVLTQGQRHLLDAYRTLYPQGLVTPNYPYQRAVEKGYFAVDQVGFFEGRLAFLAGIRHTEVKNLASASTGGKDLTQKDNTPSVGVTVEPIKGVSFFANQSRTFEPQFNVDAFGKLANNVTGKGREFGVKVDLMGSKLSGSVSSYEVTRSGEVRRDFTQEVFTGVSPIFIPGGDQQSKGIDFDLTYTPLRNYQVILSYTHISEAKVLTDLGQPFLEGSRLQNSPENQFSLWNKYTFTTGALKGLYIGAGVRQKSDNRVIVNASFNLSNPGYVVWDGLVGRDFTFAGRPVSAALNIRNLTDRYYFSGNFMPGGPRAYYLTVETKF